VYAYMLTMGGNCGLEWLSHHVIVANLYVSIYVYVCTCVHICVYVCMTVPDVPLPLQPTLGLPTSSRRPTWGKGASAAVSTVQEMSVKSDKEKDAGKHTKHLR